MADKSWEIYTELRTKSVDGLRRSVLDWAMANAPDTMRIETIKGLQDLMESHINGAARTSYDIGVDSAHTNKQ
jgi:hypothetical protein